MKLLIYTDSDSSIIIKPDIASFVVFDQQLNACLFGMEYVSDDGVIRKFSSRDDEDFFVELERIGMGNASQSIAHTGLLCLYTMPFLRKGVPEHITRIKSALAVNNYGKHLYLMALSNNAVHHSSCFDKCFEEDVKTFFP